MSEWWSYGLSDFLMFAPATYWRLVEMYNRTFWPGPLVTGTAGAAACAVAAWRPALSARWVVVPLAAAWFWVGWAFHWERLAQIHLVAPYLAGAAFVQGALLLGAACVHTNAEVRPAASRLRWAGLAVAWSAIALYPWAGLLAGRPLAQAEVFGWMPDPTALATLGLVFALVARPLCQRIALSVLPVLFLLAGAIHHASMAQ